MWNTTYYNSEGSGEVMASFHLGQKLGPSLADPNVLADSLTWLEIAAACGWGFSWGSHLPACTHILSRVASSRRESLKESEAYADSTSKIKGLQSAIELMSWWPTKAPLEKTGFLCKWHQLQTAPWLGWRSTSPPFMLEPIWLEPVVRCVHSTSL